MRMNTPLMPCCPAFIPTDSVLLCHGCGENIERAHVIANGNVLLRQVIVDHGQIVVVLEVRGEAKRKEKQRDPVQ